MEFKATILDSSGRNQQVSLDLSMYRSPLGFAGEVNARFPVAAGMPSASDQLFAQCGFYRKEDRRAGLQSPKMRAILEGMEGIQAASTSPGNVGISRFLMPAALLSAVENDIYENRSGAMAEFRNLVAVEQSVQGNRYERPVFNYTPARESRAKPVAQLAEPTSIGLLTVGETSGTIPVFSSGLEVSDPAMDYFGFAEVSKCMSIMAVEDMADRVDSWLINMVNGDADHGMVALSSLTGAGAVVEAKDFDSGIAAAGVLTQKAWVSWIAKHSKRAPITHIITDINGLLAIQNRTGRPTVQTDNPTSNRVDTVETVMNPLWPVALPVYLVTDPNWPSNLILGINQPSAIIMFESTTASYNSVEQFVTRRSTKFRVDYGAVAGRFFDRGFHPLSLTV
jgi:hypothetical protein